jgi:hypothetical protein
MAYITPFVWANIAGGIKRLMNSSGVVAIETDKNGKTNFPTGKGSGLAHVDVTLTAAQVKALNASPITLVAAPGAGFANVFEGAIVAFTYGTVAYGGIAAGEDLAIRYTDGSGAQAGAVETTGFLDQTSSQMRYVRPFANAAAALVSDVTPVANAPLVAHMLTGEITTGDSPVKVRVFYRVVPIAANF